MERELGETSGPSHLSYTEPRSEQPGSKGVQSMADNDKASKMSPRTFNLMVFFFFIFNIKFVTKTGRLKERCKRSKKGKQAPVTSFAG